MLKQKVFYFNKPEKQKKYDNNKDQNLVTAFKESFVTFFIFSICQTNGNNKGNKKNNSERNLSFA
jgi:hypothetical protein